MNKFKKNNWRLEVGIFVFVSYNTRIYMYFNANGPIDLVMP